VAEVKGDTLSVVSLVLLLVAVALGVIMRIADWWGSRR
jgi:hypothetical protein